MIVDMTIWPWLIFFGCGSTHAFQTRRGLGQTDIRLFRHSLTSSFEKNQPIHASKMGLDELKPDRLPARLVRRVLSPFRKLSGRTTTNQTNNSTPPVEHIAITDSAMLRTASPVPSSSSSPSPPPPQPSALSSAASASLPTTSVVAVVVRPSPTSLRGHIRWLRTWTTPLASQVLGLSLDGVRAVWTPTGGVLLKLLVATFGRTLGVMLRWCNTRILQPKVYPLVVPRLQALWEPTLKPRLEAYFDANEAKFEAYMKKWVLPNLDKDHLLGLIAVAASELSNREVEGSVKALIASLPLEAQRAEATTLAKAIAVDLATYNNAASNNPNNHPSISSSMVLNNLASSLGVNSLAVLAGGVQTSSAATTLKLLEALNDINETVSTTVANLTAFGEGVLGTGLGLVANASSLSSSPAAASTSAAYASFATSLSSASPSALSTALLMLPAAQSLLSSSLLSSALASLNYSSSSPGLLLPPLPGTGGNDNNDPTANPAINLETSKAAGSATAAQVVTALLALSSEAQREVNDDLSNAVLDFSALRDSVLMNLDQKSRAVLEQNLNPLLNLNLLGLSQHSSSSSSNDTTTIAVAANPELSFQQLYEVIASGSLLSSVPPTEKLWSDAVSALLAAAVPPLNWAANESSLVLAEAMEWGGLSHRAVTGDDEKLLHSKPTAAAITATFVNSSTTSSNGPKNNTGEEHSSSSSVSPSWDPLADNIT